MSILEEAAELINGDRASTYGDVTENFQRIADMWTAYKGVEVPFTAYDVSNMMILVKVARLATGGYHRDSVADIAGYAGLSEQINDKATAVAGSQWLSLSFWDEVVEALTPVAEEIAKWLLPSSALPVWESTLSAAYAFANPPKPEPRVVKELTLDHVLDASVWSDFDGDFLKLDGDKWWRKYAYPGAEWFVIQEAEAIDYELSYMATDFGPYTEVLESA